MSGPVYNPDFVIEFKSPNNSKRFRKFLYLLDRNKNSLKYEIFFSKAPGPTSSSSVTFKFDVKSIRLLYESNLFSITKQEYNDFKLNNNNHITHILFSMHLNSVQSDQDLMLFLLQLDYDEDRLNVNTIQLIQELFFSLIRWRYDKKKINIQNILTGNVRKYTADKILNNFLYVISSIDDGIKLYNTDVSDVIKNAMIEYKLFMINKI